MQGGAAAAALGAAPRVAPATGATPPGLSARFVTVVLNGRSGRRTPDESRARTEQVLAQAGRRFRIAIVEGGAGAAAAAQDAARLHGAGGIVVAAGGDGTINAVAQALTDTPVPMGLVPLGTFNYLARSLGIPLDPAEATQALLEGRCTGFGVGQVNDRLFLNNASIGLYRRIQQDRERRKRSLGRNKAVSVLAGLATLLHPQRSLRVRVDVDGVRRDWRVLTFFFGINPLQLDHLGLDRLAAGIGQERLGLLALPPVDRWELLKLALRGALHGFDREDRLLAMEAGEVLIEFPRRRTLPVALDGEIVRCSLPLRVRRRPDALQLIVPRATPAQC